ncbi:MAG: hypothetical protein V4484_08485 [Pseudomonadota bacterium]
MLAWRCLLAVVLLCPAAPSAAETLHLCADVNSRLPYLTPEGGGTTGRLVTQAAHEAGLEVEFHRVPMLRCRAEVVLNLLHGYPMTPYDPELFPIAAFPMRNGAVDPSRATVHARIMLYRRSGSKVAWSGTAIEGLERPVLISNGAILTRNALAKLKVAIDQNGQSSEVNFTKLVAGRGDVAAAFDFEGGRLMQLPRFAGKIEMLPLPLFEQTYYLAVTKRFQSRNQAAVETMWNAIGRLNQAAKTLKK